MVIIREDKGRNEARSRSKKSEKTSFESVHTKAGYSFHDARPRFLCVTRFPPSEHLALHLNDWISLSQRQQLTP